MFLTLKQLNDCQDAIARVGAIPIQAEQAATAYRMSKNVEALSKNAEVKSDMKQLQEKRLALLKKFGEARTDAPNLFNLAGDGKKKFDEAFEMLEAELVEIRIRTIDFKPYCDAIRPNSISPADINDLEFMFTFPADFDDEEKPTEKQSAKAIAGKKPAPISEPVGKTANTEES